MQTKLRDALGSRLFIWKVICVILILSCGKPVIADTRDDANFFITHLMGKGFWFRVRNDHRFNTVRFYKEALRTHRATVVDERRFRDMIPARTAQDIFDQHAAFVGNIAVAQFGAEGLSQVVDFFRTPTGERLLLIAEEEGIFEPKYTRDGYREILDEWSTFLALDDFTRYSAFSRTPPGSAFITTRQDIQDIAMSTLPDAPGFFQPDVKLLLELIGADGIVAFPNDFVREATIKEITAFLAP